MILIVTLEKCLMKKLFWQVHLDGAELKGDVDAFTQQEIQIYRAAYMTWKMQKQFPPKSIGGV